MKDRSAKSRVLAGMVSLLLALAGVVTLGEPSRASSNTNSFTIGSAKIVIEDIALCTKYKYPFDPSSNGGFTWNQTGYETCPSESLTTDSLPATLHMKFRIQSSNADDFLASYADAFITDAKGIRVNTPRWAPSPLVDLDGPFNIRDGKFYGAFSIADPKLFPVGSYTVTLQFWNSQWTKIKGPVEEVPNSINIFAFNVYPGKTVSPSPSSANSSSTTCKWESGLSGSLSKSRSMLSIYSQKVNVLAASDLTAPGLKELLDAYLADLKNELINIVGLNKFADAQYGNSQNCDEYLSFTAEAAQYAAENANIVALINGIYAKVKALAGTKNSATDVNACVDQSNAAISSITKSTQVFAAYSAKSDSGFSSTDKSVIIMFNDWLKTMESEYKNLITWQEKLPQYQKNDPDCQGYEKALQMIPDGILGYKNVVAKVNSLINKAESAQNKTANKVDEELADNEGVEEDPAANLTVTFNKSLNRFIVKVEGNITEEKLTIRATKKGAKTLRFTLETDENGVGGFRTSSKLSGYTLVLSFDSVKLDTVRVR